MEILRVSDKQLVVRVERGGQVMESIKRLVSEEKMMGGFFYGLGAIEDVELAYYDLELKKYMTRKFEGSHELTNMTGNLSWFEDELVVHAHVSLANREYQAIGGHLVEGVVSGTVELFVSEFDEKIERKEDQATGLKLMDLKKS